MVGILAVGLCYIVYNEDCYLKYKMIQLKIILNDTNIVRQCPFH